MKELLVRHWSRAGNDIAISGMVGILIGLFAMYEGYNYGLGSTSRMAPGYFPFAVGSFVIILGIALIVIGVYQDQPTPLSLPTLRAVVSVLLAMASFGLLIESAGLVPATVAMTLISAAAQPGRKLLPTVLLTIALVVFAVSVFVLGLSLPLEVIRWPF